MTNSTTKCDVVWNKIVDTLTLQRLHNSVHVICLLQSYNWTLDGSESNTVIRYKCTLKGPSPSCNMISLQTSTKLQPVKSINNSCYENISQPLLGLWELLTLDVFKERLRELEETTSGCRCFDRVASVWPRSHWPESYCAFSHDVTLNLIVCNCWLSFCPSWPLNT